MARQTQRGRGFGGEVKGEPLLQHTRENNTCPLSVTWMQLPSQELHLHRVFTHFIHLQPIPLWGFRHLLAVVSPYKPWIRGPVRAHPWPYEFATHLQIGIPHSLCSWTASQARTFTHSNTAQYLCPTPWETRFHPKRRLLGCLTGCWLDSLSASWGRPEFEPGFLPVWWAPLPSLVPVPHQVLLCVWVPHPDSPGGWVFPPDQAVCWHLINRPFSRRSGGCIPATREVKNHHLCNPGSKPPRNVTGILIWDMGPWDNSAGSNILLCWHRLSRLMSKGWEQRGIALYTLASRLQKEKARSKPYMVTCNSIGYFTLVLCDFLPPPSALPTASAIWPFPHLDSLGFISLLCHPYLPATLSEHGPCLSLFFSSLLHPWLGSKREEVCARFMDLRYQWAGDNWWRSEEMWHGTEFPGDFQRIL
jgi:hypothetical protein